MITNFNAKQMSILIGDSNLDVFQLGKGEFSIWVDHLPDFLQLYENGQNCGLMERLIIASYEEVTHVVLTDMDNLLQTISPGLFTDIIIAYAIEGNEWCRVLMKALISESITIRLAYTRK